jgi:hypothetical protein
MKPLTDLFRFMGLSTKETTSPPNASLLNMKNPADAQTSLREEIARLMEETPSPPNASLLNMKNPADAQTSLREEIARLKEENGQLEDELHLKAARLAHLSEAALTQPDPTPTHPMYPREFIHFLGSWFTFESGIWRTKHGRARFPNGQVNELVGGTAEDLYLVWLENKEEP